MERLTERKGNHTYATKDACEFCAYSNGEFSAFCENVTCEALRDRSCPYLKVIDLLAEYEDTGLTPEQIKTLRAAAELWQQ